MSAARVLLLALVVAFAGAGVAAADEPALPSGRTDYRSLADYDSDMAALAAGHPDLVRQIALPEPSIEGRTIGGVEIADGVSSATDGRPVFLVVGLTHAREWSSGEIAMEWAEHLVRDRADPAVARLLRTERTVVVPVLNPDGFVATTSGAPEHRTNCRPVGDDLAALPCADRGGVDLNRNFGAFWGGIGAGAAPGEDTYRGSGPWSEPESAGIHRLSQGLPITGVVSLHSIAGLVLRQPGFSGVGRLPDDPRLAALGDAMGAAAGYGSEPAYDLEEITGGLEDWNYFSQGAFGETIELGGARFDDDFEGPFSTHVAEQWPGVRDAIGLAAAEAAAPVDHVVVSGTAPPGARLTLSKAFSTPLSAPFGAVADGLSYALTVPASGRFVWDVGPSTRPLVQRSGGHEAWTLACGAVTHQVVAARGQAVTVAPCAAGSPVEVSGRSTTGAGARPVADLSVRAARASRARVASSGLSVRASCARACVVDLSLRRGTTVLGSATGLLAEDAASSLRVRVRAARRSAARAAGAWTLVAVAVDDRGTRTTIRRALL